ncbi:MAG TPA: flagellar basal body L-ring protein FlgH [Clostridia bacterium]|nr:flagellar basal body L-ring protein FlgH [Clostridia bacterium]
MKPLLLSPSKAQQMCRPSGTTRLSLILALSLPLALPVSLAAQSLWRDTGSASLVADKRARAVGDIVTILVQESTSASKDNNTSTAKKTGIDASIASFLYSPSASGLLTKNGQLPALKLNASQNFDGGGKINNSERITARISVRVMEVLPNGNLVLEGTKKTSVAGETQDAVLRGVVRQEDVMANNTVYSYNVADATIKYVSKGSVSDAQRKGWFTRIWDKITPF